MIDLKSQTLEEMTATLKEMGEPAFRGKQVFTWLHKGVTSFDEMSNLSKPLREKLKEQCYITAPSVARKQVSKLDGTVKYLWQLLDGNCIETVVMQYHHGNTVCVSSQVGCRMGCAFCASTIAGKVRDLTPSEILDQVIFAQKDSGLPISNIVLMGIGEPLDNLDNVLKVTQILTADYGYAWSPKRITVSSVSVGLRKKLQRFLDESECHVAISMHSPIPEQRAMLMPAERGMSIEEVVELLRNYDFSHQRRLSFEYIMFKELNDTTTHAREIVKLVKGLDCRFNLIRFHPIPNVDLQGTDDKHIESFRDYLTNHGVFTTIRASRGQDIFAACGLLSTAKKIEEERHKHESE